jgi:hypothetical protein
MCKYVIKSLIFLFDEKSTDGLNRVGCLHRHEHVCRVRKVNVRLLLRLDDLEPQIVEIVHVVQKRANFGACQIRPQHTAIAIEYESRRSATQTDLAYSCIST